MDSTKLYEKPPGAEGPHGAPSKEAQYIGTKSTHLLVLGCLEALGKTPLFTSDTSGQTVVLVVYEANDAVASSIFSSIRIFEGPEYTGVSLSCVSSVSGIRQIVEAAGLAISILGKPSTLKEEVLGSLSPKLSAILELLIEYLREGTANMISCSKKGQKPLTYRSKSYVPLGGTSLVDENLPRASLLWPQSGPTLEEVVGSMAGYKARVFQMDYGLPLDNLWVLPGSTYANLESQERLHVLAGKVGGKVVSYANLCLFYTPAVNRQLINFHAIAPMIPLAELIYSPAITQSVLVNPELRPIRVGKATRKVNGAPNHEPPLAGELTGLRSYIRLLEYLDGLTPREYLAKLMERFHDPNSRMVRIILSAAGGSSTPLEAINGLLGSGQLPKLALPQILSNKEAPMSFQLETPLYGSDLQYSYSPLLGREEALVLWARGMLYSALLALTTPSEHVETFHPPRGGHVLHTGYSLISGLSQDGSPAALGGVSLTHPCSSSS